MHRYFIIGLGWLGSPLAKTLLSAGHIVSGTTRDSDKATQLKQSGIDTYLFDLYDQDAPSTIGDALEGAYLVINIPPGRKNFSPDAFIKQMKTLFDFACRHMVKHICFVSTTSVFGEMKGRIGNETELSPNTASGNAHVELEIYLKDLAKAHDISASVLHLAGLVGEDRHPINTLSGKTNIALGKNPVNLIHQHDVVQAIITILSFAQKHNGDPQHTDPRDSKLSSEQLGPTQLRSAKSPSTQQKLNESALVDSSKSLFTENFFSANLCSAEHPSREDYYTWCAKQKNLPLPEFTTDDRIVVDGKWVDAKETVELLGIRLKYPSPYDMLP